jgi:hypothetical protein
MRPLFTIHAGELLVGDYLEKKFRHVNIWIPARDSGVDLLVTDRTNRRPVSLQVKFSRDWLVTHGRAQHQKALRASGWWSLNRKKIAASRADYWVFTLIGFANRSRDYIVVARRELLRRLDKIHGRTSRFDLYLCVTEKEKCWDTRNLKLEDVELIAEGKYRNAARDFSAFLNNWEPISRLKAKVRSPSST